MNKRILGDTMVISQLNDELTKYKEMYQLHTGWNQLHPALYVHSIPVYTVFFSVLFHVVGQQALFMRERSKLVREVYESILGRINTETVKNSESTAENFAPKI